MERTIKTMQIKRLFKIQRIGNIKRQEQRIRKNDNLEIIKSHVAHVMGGIYEAGNHKNRS